MSDRPSDAPDEPAALVDTSVAVPALLQSHEFHSLAFEAVRAHVAGIVGHALFETYAILTRHPTLRISGSQALAVLDGTFHHRVLLTKAGANRTLKALAAGGIGGGATYDGLIGATAAEAGLPLLTLDRRARRTYESIGATVRYLA